jgi:hypothetical protein
MGNVRTFTAIVLLALLPSACTEDENWSNLEKAVSVENSLGLEGPGGDLKLRLDLTKPELMFRVDELRDSIAQFMMPEFSLMHRIGRQILRERGVDPDTAFSGGPNDPRLALIPNAAQLLDRLDRAFNRNGYTVVEFYHPEDSAKVAARTPTGEGTPGPWDDHWAQYGGGHNPGVLEYDEEDIHDCAVEVVKEVGSMVVVAFAGAKLGGVAGKALISFVGGATVATVGGAINLAGIMYGAYRMGKCLDQKKQDRENGITCTMTKRLEDVYQQCLDSEEYRSPSWWFCYHQLWELNMAKWYALEKRLQKDTLDLVVSPEFTAQ